MENFFLLNKEILLFFKNNLLDINNKISAAKTKKEPNKSILSKYFEQHWAKNISELYFCVFHNLMNPPKCYCGENVSFKRLSTGYNKTCSIKCSVNSIERIEKVKKTNIEKYGFDNPMKNSEIIKKLKNTNINKYGVDNPLKNKNIRNKIKQTNINKYGVDNPLKNKEIQDKIKQTNIEKYGVENVFQSKEIKEKIKQNNLEKYGNICSLHGKEIQNKVKKTNINKYGVDNPLKNKEIISKIRKKIKEKYDVDFPLQNKEIQNKTKQTNLKKYGVENVSQKHIININNFNVKYINKNFKNKEGLLNKNDILKYFNINVSYLTKSQFLNKNNPILNFDELYPFKVEKQKTQNEIYNLIYCDKNENEEIEKNVDNQNLDKENINENYRKNLTTNNRNYINLKDNNDKVKKTLELDILDLNKNVAIEYNGLMFHSFGLNNHSMFNNDDKETENKNLHLLKTQLCEEKGIQLFHIFENEWLNERQRNIWISMINGKLNKHERIYARKTIVKEIKLKDKKGNITNKNDTDTIRNFLNTNHMQGYLPSTVNIGLFVINNQINPNTGIIEEKEELVSMIALSKPRMSKKYQWELIRYATKLNTTIVGGGSKLISFFEKIYNPESLISYANRRWSTGQFYKKTGFTFSHYSDPNYYYFKPELFKKLYNKTNNILENKENLLYSRNHFQKHKLQEYCKNNLYDIKFYDENLSETHNMYNNNYRKIYDSGNMIFTKIYNY